MPTNATVPDFYAPAISFDNQPGLQSLFERVAREGKPLTLVCGAGVSLDCGLPPWGKLVEAMCSKIQDPTLKTLIQDDSSADLMRKVEYIFAEREGYSTTRDSMVREALYSSAHVVPPFGALTTNLAHLAHDLGDRIHVVTTNFDDYLDQALRTQLSDPVAGLTIARSTDWWKSIGPGGRALSGTKFVMHAHGLIRQDEVEGPLILSEAQFREHGPAVQDFFGQLLETTDCLFIGVSLTDPNLLAPILRIRSGDGDRTTRAYVITVPDIFRGVSWKESHDYARLRCQYLAKMGLTPILLKCYSQVAQTISELRLAVKHPDEYLRADSQLRYGNRFDRILRSAYKSLGSQRSEALDACAPAAKVGGDIVGQRLFDSVQHNDSPLRNIQEIRGKWNDAYLTQFGLDRAFLDGERFGMYLWLRVQDGPGNPQFAIKLMGSSVSTHREEWSFERRADVEPNSTWAAAKVLFKGMVEFQNVTEAGRWRSMVAVPLYYRDSVDNLDRLPIGAVTFNSTHQLCNREELTARRRKDLEIKNSCKPSAISLFDDTQRRDLAEAVSRAGLRAIT